MLNYIKKIFIISFLFIIFLTESVYAQTNNDYINIKTLKNYISIIQKDYFYKKYKIHIDKNNLLYERNLENIKDKEDLKLYNNYTKKNYNCKALKKEDLYLYNALKLGSNCLYFFNTKENKKIIISNIKIYPYFETKDVEISTKFINKKINLKNGAHENYENIISLKTNDEIIIVGITNNGWYKIRYNDNIGYIPKEYVSNEKINISPKGYQTIGKCKNIEIMNDFIQKIPEKIINFINFNGWMIYLTDEKIAQTEFNGFYKSVMGVTIKDSKIIKIEDRTDAIKESLIHEVGHAIDWTDSGNSFYKYSTTEEFLNIYSTESQNSLNLSGATKHTSGSPPEYFAECINQYITNSVNMEKYCPLSYNYTKNLINSL